MTCPEPEELSRYADGASARPSAKLLASHLAGCEACAGLLEEERGLARALAVLPCPDPEALALFIDEQLPPERLDAIAAHVLGCTPCQDVVTWTREGLQQLDAAPTRRRRRTVTRQRPGSPGWLPAVAAVAAACLLLALLLQPGAPTPQQAQTLPTRPSSPRPSATPDVEPSATPDVEPSATPSATPSVEPSATPDVEPSATPSATPSDEPSATPDVEPSATPSVEPSATPSVEPSATPSATPSVEPDTRTDPSPAAAPGIQVALLDGALDWSHEAAKGRLADAEELPAGVTVRPSRGQASLRVGDTAIHLSGSLALAAADRAELLDGQALIDARDDALQVDCGRGHVRAAPAGARFAIAAEAGGKVLLSVVDGAAVLTDSNGGQRVEAGQAARLGRAGWAVTPLGDATLDALRERALEADLRAGADAPRGLLARGALEAAANELTGSPAARARAAHTVFALAATEPRLARLAAPHLPSAREALQSLLAQDDATLVAAGAAASTARALLASLTPFGQRKPVLDAPTKARLRALAEALAADPESLSADVEGLLAARAVAVATRLRLPRLEPRGDDQRVTRAILAGAKPSAAVLRAETERLQALLDQDPLIDTLGPSALLEIQRGLTVLGQWTPERSDQLLAHACLAQPGLELGLLLSQDVLRLVGRQPTERGRSSVVAVQTSAGWRVTFTLRSRQASSRLFLATSFNAWSETDLELQRRPDGTFVTTVELPAGRHEYKLVLDGGQTWETDAGNPLTGPSNVNETRNSILLLPE